MSNRGLRGVMVIFFIETLCASMAQAAGRLAGGYQHRAWIAADGFVWTQGLNYIGQLGNDGIASMATPQRPIGLSGTIFVAAGSNHTLAIKSDGTLWSWGINDLGQLGRDFQSIQILDALGLRAFSWYTIQRQPKQVDLPPVRSAAAGLAHSLAVATDGTVWVWGSNDMGQCPQPFCLCS